MHFKEVTPHQQSLT
uniref:Uncharacterized protein n=1 Tax=Rhizophora mucronata TaxID=61149 RepID=A0A2P2JED5_RHIMU